MGLLKKVVSPLESSQYRMGQSGLEILRIRAVQEVKYTNLWTFSESDLKSFPSDFISKAASLPKDRLPTVMLWLLKTQIKNIKGIKKHGTHTWRYGGTLLVSYPSVLWKLLPTIRIPTSYSSIVTTNEEFFLLHQTVIKPCNYIFTSNRSKCPDKFEPFSKFTPLIRIQNVRNIWTYPQSENGHKSLNMYCTTHFPDLERKCVQQSHWKQICRAHYIYDFQIFVCG